MYWEKEYLKDKKDLFGECTNNIYLLIIFTYHHVC